jgi:O-antigen/teichoic acid export membrane protein
VLADSLYFSLAGLFIALRKVIYTFAVGLVVQVLYLVLFLAGMIWAPSLGALLGANLLRSFMLVAAAAVLARRLLPGVKPAWRRDFFKEGAPFVLILVIALLQEKVDTLLLGFLADYEAVGHYSLALRIVTAATFIPAALAMVFFPHLAAERISGRNRAILIRAVILLAVLGTMAAIVGYIWAEPLTRVLYGQLSGTVAQLLRPLSFIFPVQFLTLFLSIALQALRQEKKALTAQAVSTAASVLLNGTLIPRFSVHGAIAARLLSSFLQLLWLGGFLRQMIVHPAAPSQPPSN